MTNVEVLGDLTGTTVSLGSDTGVGGGTSGNDFFKPEPPAGSSSVVDEALVWVLFVTSLPVVGLILLSSSSPNFRSANLSGPSSWAKVSCCACSGVAATVIVGARIVR